MVKNNHSILWTDSTIENDRAVVVMLVNKWVFGNDNHKNACVDKIIKTIQDSEWQNRFHHRIFVFTALFANDGKVIEVKFSLYCQTIDALYYLYSNDKLVDSRSFDYKVQYVIEAIYGNRIKPDTANVLRIIRNNVIHTGSIDGIDGRTKQRDEQAITKYRYLYGHTDNKSATINLATSFSYLAAEMVVRVLGLDWGDLRFNINPPSRLDIFYEKD